MSTSAIREKKRIFRLNRAFTAAILARQEGKRNARMLRFAFAERPWLGAPLNFLLVEWETFLMSPQYPPFPIVRSHPPTHSQKQKPRMWGTRRLNFPIADDSLTTLSGSVCKPSLFAGAGMELGGQSRYRPRRVALLGGDNRLDLIKFWVDRK